MNGCQAGMPRTISKIKMSVKYFVIVMVKWISVRWIGFQLVQRALAGQRNLGRQAVRLLVAEQPEIGHGRQLAGTSGRPFSTRE